MIEFLKNNWKNITLGILGVIFVYLLVRVFTPTPDMSELNKYKLEQIDKHINEMKTLQKSLSDSIQVYQNKIDEIDDKISNIKVEKKEVNNFYT
jgi:peptidoglycan hydrolase CwlO-like protein